MEQNLNFLQAEIAKAVLAVDKYAPKRHVIVEYTASCGDFSFSGKVAILTKSDPLTSHESEA